MPCEGEDRKFHHIIFYLIIIIIIFTLNFWINVSKTQFPIFYSVVYLYYYTDWTMSEIVYLQSLMRLYILAWFYVFIPQNWGCLFTRICIATPVLFAKWDSSYTFLIEFCLFSGVRFVLLYSLLKGLWLTWLCCWF